MSAIRDAHKKKVGVNYYITQWIQEVNQLEIRWLWRSDELERRCWIAEHVPERMSSQAPGWAAQEKETWLWPIEWGSICCSSVRSPTPSHTEPFRILSNKVKGIFFLKEVSSLVLHSAVMFLHACICIWVYNKKCYGASKTRIWQWWRWNAWLQTLQGDPGKFWNNYI